MKAEATLMFAEASEAGSAVARQLAANGGLVGRWGERLRRARPRAVLTCARGSSDHAATFAKYLIETRTGTIVASAAPSVSSIYGAEQRVDEMLCLAISQSGRSPDLVAMVESARAAGACTIALVNDEATPLADAAECVIPLCAGPEKAIAATKSYIASLAALVHIVAAWTGDDALMDALDAAPSQLAEAWTIDWAPLVDRLADAEGLYVLGRGLGLGIAGEAALKLKETCGLHAEPFSVAEVRHGPIALAGKGFPLLVFRQEDETAAGVDAFAAEAAAAGADVFLVGAAVPGATSLPTLPAHPAIAPMLEILSFYRAVNALAVRRGLDPDLPPGLAKVTETL
jgi:glucosamine--fructose-6-phosphate aminotransferase (isomerizing)